MKNNKAIEQIQVKIYILVIPHHPIAKNLKINQELMSKINRKINIRRINIKNQVITRSMKAKAREWVN